MGGVTCRQSVGTWYHRPAPDIRWVLQLTAPAEHVGDAAPVPVEADRVALARLRACCEDALYCWALGEAYCGHPVLRRDMRCAASAPAVCGCGPAMHFPKQSRGCQ